MQVIASHRTIAPSRAALASKPVRSLRRASGSVARRSADRVILSTRAMAEEGAADEVRRVGGQPLAPEQCPVYNPAFDVTPASLITAIVTESGVVHSPDATSVAEHLSRLNRRS